MQTPKWLMFIVLLSILFLEGCSVMDNMFGRFKKSTPSGPVPITIFEEDSKPLLEIDPITGIQYYLSEDLVQNFALPSGMNTKMVLIPGGEFIMGLNDEDPLGIQPAGNVRIAVNSFWVDQFEVTNQQYREFLNTLDPTTKDLMLPDSTAWAKEVGIPWRVYFRDDGYANYPVVCVTWEQATAFAVWAGKRLLTESEWEYAARSGVSGRIYPWEGIYSRNAMTGRSLANFAPAGDYAVDGFVITAPVGSFPSNNFRIYDMAGNVAEWCQDNYFPSYKVLKRTMKQLVTPSYMNTTDPRKIVRGGSWASDEFYIGVGVRDYRFKDMASPRVGFRCAKDATNPLLQKQAREGYLLRTQQTVNPNVQRYQQDRN